MLRPKARVLKDSDLVPAGRVVKPPAKFTHELRRSQSYYYELGGEIPDGTFAAGTRVKRDRLATATSSAGSSPARAEGRDSVQRAAADSPQPAHERLIASR